MKTWFDTPRQLFAVLRALSVVCVVIGIALSAAEGVLPEIKAMGSTGVTALGVFNLATMAVNALLWCVAWGAFMGLCGRMMQGGTAFTAENSRTLRTITVCVAAIGTLLLMRGLPEMARVFREPELGLLYLLTRYFPLGVVLPGVFGTAAVLATILRRLLDNAIALEAEQQDVV